MLLGLGLGLGSGLGLGLGLGIQQTTSIRLIEWLVPCHSVIDSLDMNPPLTLTLTLTLFVLPRGGSGLTLWTKNDPMLPRSGFGLALDLFKMFLRSITLEPTLGSGSGLDLQLRLWLGSGCPHKNTNIKITNKYGSHLGSECPHAPPSPSSRPKEPV